MTQDARGVPEDLEQLRQRFNEFRSTNALLLNTPNSVTLNGSWEA